MLILTISPDKQEHLSLVTRIEELSLAKKIIHDTGIQEAILIEDDEKRIGVKNILDYLNKMEGFMVDWYNCKCDLG